MKVGSHSVSCYLLWSTFYINQNFLYFAYNFKVQHLILKFKTKHGKFLFPKITVISQCWCFTGFWRWWVPGKWEIIEILWNVCHRAIFGTGMGRDDGYYWMCHRKFVSCQRFLFLFHPLSLGLLVISLQYSLPPLLLHRSCLWSHAATSSSANQESAHSHGWKTGFRKNYYWLYKVWIQPYRRLWHRPT